MCSVDRNIATSAGAWQEPLDADAGGRVGRGSEAVMMEVDQSRRMNVVSRSLQSSHSDIYRCMTELFDTVPYRYLNI